MNVILAARSQLETLCSVELGKLELYLVEFLKVMLDLH